MSALLTVRPSGDRIPEQTLRLSAVFGRPQARPVLDRVALLGEDGRVRRPFLPEALWSADRRVLTLLFEPGQVKTGLLARAAGAPLRAGEVVSLLLDGVVVKTWAVDPGGLATPDPRKWALRPPAPGSHDALIVELDSPIDALAVGFIAVLGPDGRRVGGRASLEDGERLWSLSPEAPWREGRHALVVHPNLENCCGDAVGEAFEHPPGEGLGAHREATQVPFEVSL